MLVNVLVAALCAGAWLSGARGAETGQAHVTTVVFEVTLAASIQGTLDYRVRETRDGCTYETTVFGTTSAFLQSTRASPATVVVVKRAGRRRTVALGGTARFVSGTLSYGLPPSVTRDATCGSSRGAITSCRPVVPPPVRGLTLRFASDESGGIAFEPSRAEFFATKLGACGAGPSLPETALGGLERATARVPQARLLDPRVKRVVIEGRLAQTRPLAGADIEGSLGRRVHWRLTLRRLRAAR